MCTATPPGDDRKGASWIQDKMRYSKKTWSVQGEYTIDEIAGLLSRCYAIVSTRLHGFAIGVGVGVPSLAIAFHPKMKGLAEELGLSDWVFQFQDLPVKTITNTVQDILRNREEARVRVRVGVKKAMLRAKFDFIEGVTGERPCS
jgi:polysaccharide pyruvyl transferase WcaK-like protein